MSEEQVEQQEETERVEEQQPEDDRLLRLAADFDNYKKRAARERSSTSPWRTSGSSPS